MYVTSVLGLICAGKDVNHFAARALLKRIDLVSILAVSAVAGDCVCLEGRLYFQHICPF